MKDHQAFSLVKNNSIDIETFWLSLSLFFFTPIFNHSVWIGRRQFLSFVFFFISLRKKKKRLTVIINSIENP